MVLTTPLIVAALAVAACGFGMCGVAHRLLDRGKSAGAHCSAPTGRGNRFSRAGPVLFTALFCGLAMAAVAYLQPH